jgi:hypothetical protein
MVKKKKKKKKKTIKKKEIIIKKSFLLMIMSINRVNEQLKKSGLDKNFFHYSNVSLNIIASVANFHSSHRLLTPYKIARNLLNGAGVFAFNGIIYFFALLNIINIIIITIIYVFIYLCIYLFTFYYYPSYTPF